MAQPRTSPADPDLERTIRLRENKRRYRTRQKDYIAGLEQRLRRAREEGIQATKEVQLSAQRVVRENERLKQLLRHKGIDDSVIAIWIRKDDDSVNKTTTCSNSCGNKTDCKRNSQVVISQCDETRQDGTRRLIANETIPIQSRAQEPAVKEFEPNGQYLASTKPSFIETSPMAPCKLISQLAANPSADLTQVPITVDGTDNSDEREGVECSKAYQMLMQYGTTDAKLDTIALALENGCVPSKTPGGGCSVRREFIWKALDDLQS